MKNITYLLILLPLLSLSQSLKGNFKPAKDFTYAILYKAQPNGVKFLKQIKLDSLGKMEVPLDATFTPGIYKIVYGAPPQEKFFDFIYNGKESLSFNFSYQKGLEFTASLENNLLKEYFIEIQKADNEIWEYYSKKETSKEKLRAIFKSLNDTQVRFEKKAAGTMAATIVNANKPYIPKIHQDFSIYIKSLKTQAFKNIDFSNELLSSSGFIHNYASSFIFGIHATFSDASYKENIDIVVQAIPGEQQIFKSQLLEMFWKDFGMQGKDPIANYIADKYLIKLAKATGNTELNKKLIAFKNTSIGVIAPDFKLKDTPDSKKLSTLKGHKYYVLVFWSSTCGHCLTAMPKIKDLFKDNKEVQVITFGLEDDDTSWTKEVKNYPNFINGIGLGHWDNEVAELYDITGTPTYFILDSEKKIISKPYALEQMDAFFKKK